LFLFIFFSILAKAQQSEGNKITESQPKHLDSVFTAVEIRPEFPGGEYAFFKYLSTHLIYPTTALRNRIGGRVTAQFIVERDGSLVDFKIIASPSDDLSLEAIRVLSMSPHWKPAVQNGKPVRMQFTVPIKFTLPANLPPRDTSNVFEAVETVPAYPGGTAAFDKFIKKNMQYPKAARKNRIEGTVYVQYIVEKSGELTDMHVERGINTDLDNEAMRIMTLPQKWWSPGMHDGKPVRVRLTIPIAFTLQP